MATVEQLRAARALLGWSQTELASRAGLSLPTVKRVEGGFGPNVSEESRLRLQEALEADVASEAACLAGDVARDSNSNTSKSTTRI